MFAAPEATMISTEVHVAEVVKVDSVVSVRGGFRHHVFDFVIRQFD